MEIITDIASLKRQIASLELKREVEKQAVTEEVSDFLESIKPINLLKGLFTSIKNSPSLKADLVHGAIGVGTGFLTNKLLLGSLQGPVKKILGMVLQAGITNAAVKYPEAIKSKGLSLLTNFFKSIKLKSDSIAHQHLESESQL